MAPPPGADCTEGKSIPASLGNTNPDAWAEYSEVPGDQKHGYLARIVEAKESLVEALRSFSIQDLKNRRTLLTGAAILLVLTLLGTGIWTQTDLDEDGLKTVEEWETGTDPLLTDTDGDSLGDGWETREGLNPLSRDSDNDTLTDEEELAKATNPTSSDSDDDSLDDARELRLGTDPRTSDTDGDRIEDALELGLGTDPTLSDTDGDGLTDSTEVLEGANPLDVDTDGDGILDEEEAVGGFRDCDNDGYPAIADTDDDSDFRPDHEEPAAHRCDEDVDDDGLLDGQEANPRCIDNVDCDSDGLQDGTEAESDFDRLQQDTFETGLSDSVAYAFRESGQEPSEDEDGDGIPDAWETSDGLVGWGPYEPAPGRKDLLVEFVKIGGPSLADRAYLPPSYRQVEDFFEQDGGYNFDWTSTTVEMPAYEVPPLLPSSDSDYYRRVLEETEHSENPYVTTVVLNAHHDQRAVTHLGVAPIRSMLAAVDYGFHTTVEFSYEDCDFSGNCSIQTFETSPALESLIYSDRQDVLSQYGYTWGGITTEGRYFVEAPSYTFSWEPFWFGNGRNAWVSTAYEDVYPSATGVNVRYGILASTIVHELGHTLGLCHMENAECRAETDVDPGDSYERSTMHSESVSGLHLLDQEWGRMSEYLTCPPTGPLRRIADGGSDSALIEAKYSYSFESELGQDIRECQNFKEVDATMEPVERSSRYDPNYPEVAETELTEEPSRFEDEPMEIESMARENDVSRTHAYALIWLAVGLVGAIAGMVVQAYRRPSA